MTVNMNGVGYLHDSVFERESWNLVYEYSKYENWDIATPIPVETIAEVYLGYQINLTDEGIFSDPSVLGGIIFEEKTIQVNGAIENQDGRFNFTVAHELGHHKLHKDWLYGQKKQQNLFELADTPSILCREEGVKPRGELQADRFAAALLMPEHLVKEAFKKQYKKVIDVTKYIGLLGQSPEYKAIRIAQKIMEIGGFTNVSKNAMANRLKYLNLITGVDYLKNQNFEMEGWLN